jgi:DNA-directed RNA polymerase subunit RPC12/RpoP
MTIEFTCQKCEGGFEIEAPDLIDGSEKLECPHCGAKAPSSMSEDLINALNELRGALTSLSKKFSLSMTLESEDLEDLDEEEDDDEDDEDLDDDEEEDDDLDDDEDDEDYDDEDDDDL